MGTCGGTVTRDARRVDEPSVRCSELKRLHARSSVYHGVGESPRLHCRVSRTSVAHSNKNQGCRPESTNDSTNRKNQAFSQPGFAVHSSVASHRPVRTDRRIETERRKLAEPFVPIDDANAMRRGILEPIKNL